MAAFDGLPNIPDVPNTGNHEQDEFFRSVKENLEKMQGKDPLSSLDQRVLSQREHQEQTCRDWPGATFVSNTDHGLTEVIGSANYTEIWFTDILDYPFSMPTNYNIDMWKVNVPVSTNSEKCGITVPEDGLYFILYAGLINSIDWAAGEVIQCKLLVQDSRNNTTPSALNGSVGTVPSGYVESCSHYVQCRNATYDAWQYHNVDFSGCLYLPKGSALGVRYWQSAASNAHIATGTWQTMQVIKIREMGWVPHLPNQNIRPIADPIRVKPNKRGYLQR